MERKEIQELAATIISDVQREFKEIQHAKLDFRDVPRVIILIGGVVKCVEKQAETIKMAGEEKRALAVEILNAFINVPVLPEYAEGVLLGLAVDAVVALFNRYVNPPKKEENPAAK